MKQPLSGRFSLATWVRPAWLLVTLVGALALALALPGLWDVLTTVCTGAPCASGQPVPEGLAALARLGLPPVFYGAVILGMNVLVPVVIILVMGFLLWKKPRERTVVLLAFAGVTCSLVGGMAPAAEQHAWLDLPLRAYWFISGAGFAFGLLAFPDGRFMPGWGRWIALALALASVFVLVPGLDRIGEALASAAFLLTFPMALILLSIRYRRAQDPQRQQIKWVLFSIGVIVASLFIGLIHDMLQVPAGAPGSLFAAFLASGSIAFFWLCIAASVYRSNLFDIDLIIERTLVYGALSVGVILVYIVIIVATGFLSMGSNDLLVSLLAAGVVALAFQPIREGLQRRVNRLLYGERDEPYKVLSKLSDRIEGTLEPAKVLPAITETVAQVLKLPYAGVVLARGGISDLVASHGQPGGETVALALVHQGETVGELRLEPRAGETFKASELQLLRTIAQQASVAAYAVRQNLDLQSSREALVTAREEERLRIRRDLHDGLGPELANLTLKLDTVRNLLKSDAERAEALLLELKVQSQEALAGIRRLVHALRPPALDELGLAGALREEARKYDAALYITLELGNVMHLPAAVEVACYRIVQEALTNVIRHSRATRCSVLVHADASLTIRIEDDGVGLPESLRMGVGLQSMRERAEELGGTFRLETRGGVQLLVALPL
jgi:signal transduction histidine kinase